MPTSKKICMLGAFAVGKTSLVLRFVDSLFDETYHTTIGVKVDTRLVSLDGQDLTLVLWDLAGEDEFNQVKMEYLRGVHGYLLVVDGTRRVTLDKAVELRQRVVDSAGEIPFLALLNKVDLENSREWELDDQMIADSGLALIKTSAKTGQDVEEAFTRLAQMMLDAENGGE